MTIAKFLSTLKGFLALLGDKLLMFLVMWLLVGTVMGTMLPSLVVGVFFGKEIILYVIFTVILSAVMSSLGFFLISFLELRQIAQDDLSDAACAYLAGGFLGGAIASVLLVIAKIISFVLIPFGITWVISPGPSVVYWVAPAALFVGLYYAIYEYRKSIRNRRVNKYVDE